MLELYLEIQNNQPINHPMTFESAQHRLAQVLDIVPDIVTKEMLLTNGFKEFEDVKPDPFLVHIISDSGYILTPTGKYNRKYITKELTQEEKLNRWIRDRRNHLLYCCDWTQNSDNQLSSELRLAWKEHRQQLRDLPQLYSQVKHPSEINWPQPPQQHDNT